MKKILPVAMLSALSLALLVVLPAAAASFEKEFRYGAERFTLERLADGTTRVGVEPAARETRPGLPDLPMVAERVEIPVGQRLVGVEVLDLESAPLGHGLRMPSSELLAPGGGPIQRTPPDPASFRHAGFLPEQVASVGSQGFERGRNVAYVLVAPARWDPSTGELARVSRVRVRLDLAPTDEQPLVRERIVPEWEDGPVSLAVRGAASASVKPVSGATPFMPTQIPSVLGSPVAYVIVTSDSMAPVFQQLADWKTQCGIPAAVRTMSFIKQQYPFGADDAERVRLFLRDAYTRWGTKWVLLGGDTDVIPVRLAYTTFYGGESIATDTYYACLDGNWNADGDSLYGEGFVSSTQPGDNVDLMPELDVGRAPVSTAAQAQVFLNKTFTYEKNVVNDYTTNLLFFAEVLFPQPWNPGDPTSLDGAELVDFDLLPIFDTVPWIHYSRLYENYTDSRWRPGSLREYKQAVMESLNVGYNISVHVGHGYRNVMNVADDDLTNADAMSLTNGPRFTNLYAIDCTSNAIDFPCIGKAFIQNPNGGAVSNIGSTRFDFPTAGRSYQQQYFTLLYEDSVTALGDAFTQQKLPFVGFSVYDGVNRWTQMTLLLLGDPELRIYTNQPRTLTVAAPASIQVSDTTVAVNVKIGGNALAGARVTAYKPGVDLATSLTDASGNVVLPFRPDSTGSLTVTVTGFNCRPYQVTVPISSSGGPSLAEKPFTVDDGAALGTFGNNSGAWDAGETVDLHVPLKNNGGSSATSVIATVTTTDTMIVVLQPSVNYGTIAAGATSNPVAGFRVRVPYYAPDQREVPFVLRTVDGAGHSDVEKFQVTVRAPDLRHFAHSVLDPAPGNGNGRPDPGENVSYFVKLRNLGTGVAPAVTAKLRSLDGKATVTDSTAAWGDIASGAEATGDAFAFHADSANARLQLVVSDSYGTLFSQTLDLTYPDAPTTLQGIGAASSVALTWAKSAAGDLMGYNVYRSSTLGGTYSKVNPSPTDRTAYFQDEGLAPLTRYYYKVSAVDSSGNESLLSAAQSSSTNPPLHAIFPIPTGRNTPAPVAVDHIYPGYPADIVAGSDVLYLWHPDGTAPVDADGNGATSGDFTTAGSYYAAGASIADLDGGGKEIIAPTWDDMRVYVFDQAGNFKPGWPAQLADNLWSAVAVGDLFGDGQKELVLGSNGYNVYALRSNGTELMDGDSNPSTFGVFKVTGAPFNFGTPALAPLEGGSQLDIVFGSTDGHVYAWRPNGSNVPGFPVAIAGGVSASVAVGSLDGPGGPLSVIVPSNADSLYVFGSNGARRPGFPAWIRLSGNSKTPSPALADMDGDGFLDIVIASTNGGLFVYNRNGNLIPPWANIRYSTLTNGASECSPVVADINGDGKPDIVTGDENGQLAAISGADATMLPGFPIQLAAEVRGTPALCDCDGDGKTEIVVAGWDKNVYVWDYDFPFSPAGPPPWPQFHHDAARTGYAGSPVFVGVGDETQAAPATLQFSRPAPNPAQGPTRISYSVPSDRVGASVELGIYDLSGRRVRLLEQGRAQAGPHSVSWDLRDESGARVGAGVYFLRLRVAGDMRSQKLVVVR